jgi:hypothetical protein
MIYVKVILVHGERTLTLPFMIFYFLLMMASILLILLLRSLPQCFELFMIEPIFLHPFHHLINVLDKWFGLSVIY